MSASLDPRVKRIIQLQNWAMIANTIIASWISISVATSMFDNVTAFFVALVGAWFLIRIMNKITLVGLQFFYYGFNSAELAHDASEAVKFFNEQANPATDEVVNKLALKIVAQPEKPAGRYMDAPFYEWVDIEDMRGVVHRFSFAGTMDITRGITQKIPDNCILLPPGILYQVDPPVNTAT